MDICDNRIIDLNEKIILVTGSSRGIGRAIAEKCANHGATVIIHYNTRDVEAEKTFNKIISSGGKAMIVQGDISKEEDVIQIFKTIKAKYSRLDVLVNNAGVMKNNLLPMVKTEDFDKMVSINCLGPFLCSRSATKMMIKQKSGKIINISSIVGRYGNRGQSVYSGTKSFLIGFTYSLAKELGPLGITVNGIAPGFIETDLSADTSMITREELLKNTPLGRFGSPEDVARVALFLISDLGNYISGQVIGVDGGEVI